MVVLAHVVVVEVNEALNCLFNRGHLEKRHFVIPEGRKEKRGGVKGVEKKKR